MTKIENKIFSYLQKNILFLFLAAATVCGIIIHTFGLNFKSDDYQSFLYPWWIKIEQGGLKGLATQVGNYNIPYQIITFLFTLLPFGPLRSYKFISILFDFVLAVSAGLLVSQFSKSRSQLRPALAYAAVFCSITVVLNSSFWAQCDSIYTSFILLAIYFLKRDKNITSFVMLGIAFAFKLQTVFIIPVFLFYYICTRRVSILHFLIIPAVDIVMCLPAVLLGRNALDIFTIYAVQTDYGHQIQMNCPNIYAFLCDGTNTANYYLLKPLSIVLTITILGAALSVLMYKKVDLTNRENFLLASIWSVFTCIMFLSSMHERYSYLLDILAIVYALSFAKRYWLPALCTLISLRGYASYLFQYEAISLQLCSLVFIALYIYISICFVKEVILNGKKINAATELSEAA